MNNAIHPSRTTIIAGFVAAALLLVLASGNVPHLLAQEAATSAPAAETTEPAAPSEPAEASRGTIAGGGMLAVMFDGGPLMWPIAASFFLLTVFVLERLIMLRRGRIVPRVFVGKFMEQIRAGQLGRDAALELCEKNGSPVAQVFIGPLKKWGRPAVEVEQAVIDAGERVTHDLRRYLRLFNGISSVAPLLGLLGTVLGMISSFNAIVTSDAMGKSELLAGGIGQALLTTAGGLFVAIPAMIAYMFFQSRVETLVMEIDHVAQQLVEAVSAEGLEREGSVKSKKSKAA